jgi:CO dehydrogenase maturation factor
MARDMKLNPGVMKLIVNRVPGGVLEQGIVDEIEAHGLELVGVIPQDDAVYRCDSDGEPSSKVPDGNPAKTAVAGIAEKLGF